MRGAGWRAGAREKRRAMGRTRGRVKLLLYETHRQWEGRRDGGEDLND